MKEPSQSLVQVRTPVSQLHRSAEESLATNGKEFRTTRSRVRIERRPDPLSQRRLQVGKGRCRDAVPVRLGLRTGEQRVAADLPIQAIQMMIAVSKTTKAACTKMMPQPPEWSIT